MRFFLAVIFCALFVNFICACSYLDILPGGQKSPADKNNATPSQSKQSESNAAGAEPASLQSPEFTDDYPVFETASFPALKPNSSEIVSLYPFLTSSGKITDLVTVNKDGQVAYLSASRNYSGGKLILGIPKDFTSTSISREALIFAAAYPDKVSVFDLRNGKELYKITRINTRLGSMEFNPAGDALILGGVDGVVYRWQFELEEEADTIKDAEKALERYIGHSTVANVVRFHPFGRIFVSSDWGGVVLAWLLYDKDRYSGEYDENTFIGRFFTENVSRVRGARTALTIVEEIKFSHDGRYFFVADEGGILESWGVRGFKQLITTQAHQGKIYDFSIDPLNRVASVGRDGKLKLFGFNIKDSKVPGVKEYELALLKEVSLKDSGAENARKIVFIDNENVALAGADGQIKIVNIKI